MNDRELRCDSCTRMIELTRGPAFKVRREDPPHYMARGYAIERAKRTYYICEPCLTKEISKAVKA